jgi:hypothetical protein
MPNVIPQQNIMRSNIQSLTEKLIPHTPSHKQPEIMTTIKRIQNFSYALND